MSRKMHHKAIGKAGLAEVKVTPQYRPLMWGYGDPENRRRVAGVHDDLFARALVLETAGSRVAILSVPVCSMDADITAQVRKEASSRTGIPARNILIHGTHTHSAPYVKGKYKTFLRQGCIRCLAKAWRTRFPARIGVGLGVAEDAGRNRRALEYGGLPVDPEIGVIKVEDARGKLRGVVFNYACHGTTLGYHNRLISEDWPFYTIAALKAGVRGSPVGVFLQGASGDINPGYSAGLSAVHAEIPIRTWEEARKLGERVAAGILDVLPRIRARRDFALASRTAYVDLPLRRRFPMTLKKAQQQLLGAKRRLARRERSPSSERKTLEHARMEAFFAEVVLREAKRFYSRPTSEETVRAELQAVVLADSVIATFPGEVFVEGALAVKRQSPVAKTMIVGLANAHEACGYLPTREAYAEGDYEVFESYHDESALEALVSASVENIAQFVG